MICYAMKENLHEIKDFQNYWRGRVDHARIFERTSEQFANQHTNLDEVRKFHKNKQFSRIPLCQRCDM